MSSRKIVPAFAAGVCLVMVAATSTEAARPTPEARRGFKRPSLGKVKRDRFSRQLGKIKPLDGAAKLQLLAPLGVKIELADLSQPFSLDVRAPYRDSMTYLELFDPLLVQPQTEPPQARMRPCSAQACTSWAQLGFQAQGGKTYLVDCGVAGTNAYDVVVYDAGQRSEQSHTNPGGHLTIALPARPQPRSVSVMVMAPSHWAFAGCEVTPVG